MASLQEMWANVERTPKMMQYWSHFKYTTIHKYFVFLECCKRGIVWRGIMHDMSKFSPSEFGAYANYFFNPDGTRKNHPENNNQHIKSFERAWCHHAHHNDHHWNYWIINTHHSPNLESVVIPTMESIKEMAADMIGANAAQGNINPLENVKRYYLEHKDRIILHSTARSLLEYELGVK
jgi:hypothetical protein